MAKGRINMAKVKFRDLSWKQIQQIKKDIFGVELKFHGLTSHTQRCFLIGFVSFVNINWIEKKYTYKYAFKYFKDEFVDGSGGDIMSKSEFEQRFEEYVEFEWVVVKSLDLSLGFDELRLKKQFYVDFELLLNYNRYRELVDTVELREYCYSILGSGVDEIMSYEKSPLELAFSTKAHAQAFLKLAQDNGCL
jgi:hypothetical protein